MTQMKRRQIFGWYAAAVLAALLVPSARAILGAPPSAPSAPPASDSIPAQGGAIIITPIFHGTVQIEYGGKVIVIDPWSQADLSAVKPADLVLITDIHGDHLDLNAIRKVRKARAPIIAPRAASKQLDAVQDANRVYLDNGADVVASGVTVEAVPMYNLVRGPEPGKLFHDKGRGNGYVLTVGGRRLYFSGDTENVPELRKLKNVDVAFVCMNLPYTMPPVEAAALVKAMKPRIVYPYHYRGSNTQEFADALKSEKNIEVRLRDFYAASAARRAR